MVHNNGEVAANDLSQADGTAVVGKEGDEALASPPIRLLGSSSKCNLASDWPWLLRAAVRAQPTNFRPGPARVSATLIGRHSGSTYQRWEPAGNRAGNTPLDPGSNSVNRKCLKRVSCSDLMSMSDQIMTGSLSHTPCTAAATSFWSCLSPSTLTLFQVPAATA